MKKLLILFLLVGSLFAQTTKEGVTKVDCESILKTGDKALIAKSGCCSWHGGVCDCGYNGRVICCDGSYSPSCTCNKSNDLIKGSTGNKL